MNQKFLELGGYDTNTHETRFVCVDEFKNEYSTLKLGNGGSWCRFDGPFGKSYKVCKVRRNRAFDLSWSASIEEKKIIENEIGNLKDAKFGKGQDIYLIKVYGKQDGKSARPIRKDIRDIVGKSPCVSCGSSHSIEVDHKNGLYNDPRVLDLNRQTIEDFQSLCKHCNTQKRETYNEMKRTKKRYPATRIPKYKNSGVAFIKGDDTYDPNDINTMVGTYWYDPIKFNEEIQKRYVEKLEALERELALFKLN